MFAMRRLAPRAAFVCVLAFIALITLAAFVHDRPRRDVEEQNYERLAYPKDIRK
jgi:hypothetical protein